MTKNVNNVDILLWTQVKVVIDGQEFSKQFASYTDIVNTDLFYFGGMSNILQQTGSHFSSNFNGTISEVVICYLALRSFYITAEHHDGKCSFVFLMTYM